MNCDPGRDKKKKINKNEGLSELKKSYPAKIPVTVIDFNRCRIERNLAERGITVKRNRDNKVKILLRLGDKSKKS